jgi:dihydroorotate dehydrogenase
MISGLFRWSSSDPERAHDLVIRGLARVSASPRLVELLRRLAGGHSGAPPAEGAGPPGREVFGLTFPNPVGLASGFDKNGVALPALAALGFGFLEAGTVTRVAQPGNPRPRIVRMEDRRAIVNWMGFPSAGVDAVVCGLLRRSAPVGVPVGWNISKSRATPPDEAAADCVYLLERLYPYGDYFVVNVSSPNTPGLRDMQYSETLAALVRACTVRARDLAKGGAAPKPVLLKISPDLTDERLDGIVGLCVDAGIAGVVATNTVPAGQVLDGDRPRRGGVSGAPLAPLALRTVRALHDRLAGRLPIIAVGGVASADDARAMLDAGAALIQVYTAFVYGGPRAVADINRAVRDAWLRAEAARPGT